MNWQEVIERPELQDLPFKMGIISNVTQRQLKLIGADF